MRIQIVARKEPFLVMFRNAWIGDLGRLILQIANHPQFVSPVNLPTPTDSVTHRFVFKSQLSCLLILQEREGQPVFPVYPVNHNSNALVIIVHEGWNLFPLNFHRRFELELSGDELFIEDTQLYVGLILGDQCTFDLCNMFSLDYIDKFAIFLKVKFYKALNIMNNEVNISDFSIINFAVKQE